MPNRDARIDAYIESSKEFAKPILEHIRRLVHAASPDIKETIKWGMPFFDLKGPVCHMASFKAHCVLGFWKQSLLDADFPAKNAMGSFGRIASVADLPEDNVIIKLIIEAIRLNTEGIKVEKTKLSRQQELIVPEVFLEALAKNQAAAETFNSFPYSSKKEYVEWVAEAKTDTTRDKRLFTTIEWLSEGKRKNWKYEKC